MAAQKGLADVCTVLLKNNANVNEKRAHGAIPLLIAAEIGHADVCTVLVENKANVMKKDKFAQQGYLWQHKTVILTFVYC